MKDQTRASLELFIEKADELRLCNLAKYAVETDKVNLKISISSEHGESVEYTGPDEEAMRAFLLTLRFFIQDRDTISIRYLEEKVCNDPDLSAEWKQNIRKSRADLHLYLNQHIQPGIVYEPPPTLKEVVDTFIYGNLAHADNKYRERFKKWKQNKIMYATYNMFFHGALFTMFSLIMYISVLTEIELRVSM